MDTSTASVAVTPMPSETSCAVREICEAFAALAQDFPDGRLDDDGYTEIKSLFSRLDRHIQSTGWEDAARILGVPLIGGRQALIQKFRANYELRAEQELASLLVKEPETCAQRVKDYMAHHLPSTAIHSAEFKQAVSGRTNCLVVGCGAFPSTALLLLDQTSLDLSCIDRVAESCELAAQVIPAEYRNRVEFWQRDIDSLRDMSRWDIIFVSALAGVDWQAGESSRRDMIGSILQQVRPGTLLVLRTAYALGQLVYPAIDRDWFRDYRSVEIAAPVIGRSALLLVEA